MTQMKNHFGNGFMNIQLRVTKQTGGQRLNALLELGRQPAPGLRAMGETLLALTRGTFHGTANRPSPWPRLKKTGQPSHLRKTDRLVNSLQLRLTNSTATVSTPVIYAATHQFGRNFGRGHPIPARPFLPVLNGELTPAARDQILAAARRAFERAVK